MSPRLLTCVHVVQLVLNLNVIVFKSLTLFYLWLETVLKWLLFSYLGLLFYIVCLTNRQD